MKRNFRKLGGRFRKPEICVSNNVYFTRIFDGDLLRIYVRGVRRRWLRLNDICVALKQKRPNSVCMVLCTYVPNFFLARGISLGYTCI